MQPVAGPAGEGRQGGRARRGRLPDGVRHDLGVRRHLDGPRGHALLAGVPRGDRRQRRDRHDGRAPRRLGAAGRLRQVAARHADGRRPPRPGQGVPLRRIDHARQGQADRRHRARRHDHRRVRGRRRLLPRADVPRGRRHHRARHLSRRGRLRRHVHRQHHGQRRRGDRHVAAGQRGPARQRPPPRRVRQGAAGRPSSNCSSAASPPATS